MRISRIKRHARLDRARIYVDHEDTPRVELPYDLVLQQGLGVGDVLDRDLLDALERQDESFRAREAALRLLSHRPRSAAELRRRLDRKDVPAATIEATLAWLDERGYVDDRAFAEAFVRDRLRLRPKGRLGLLQELRRKGIDAPTAEAATSAAMAEEDVDEEGLAVEAARSWARSNRPAVVAAGSDRDARQRARRRLYGHLARRGFAPDAVRAALAVVLGD